MRSAVGFAETGHDEALRTQHQQERNRDLNQDCIVGGHRFSVKTSRIGSEAKALVKGILHQNRDFVSRFPWWEPKIETLDGVRKIIFEPGPVFSYSCNYLNQLSISIA